MVPDPTIDTPVPTKLRSVNPVPIRFPADEIPMVPPPLEILISIVFPVSLKVFPTPIKLSVVTPYPITEPADEIPTPPPETVTVAIPTLVSTPTYIVPPTKFTVFA